MDSLLNRAETLASQLGSHLPPAAQAYLTRDNVRALLRVVVIVSTYVLFRPHLEALMRKMSGVPDPRRAEVEARMEVLREQRQQHQQHQQQVEVSVGGKKRIAVVGGDGKVVGLLDPDGEGDAGKKRNGTPGGKKKKKGP